MGANALSVTKYNLWSVCQAVIDDASIRRVNLEKIVTMNHITQFVERWAFIQDVHLVPDRDDDILWKFTKSGIYTTKSAYNMQFLGMIDSDMLNMIWKAWAPPKSKFFVLKAIQNRIWTADRLQKRGWPNCGLCPLCKQTTETVSHLFVH
jgi:hypothetical protein